MIPRSSLLFWLPAVEGYVDELGRPEQPPAPGARRAMTRFDRDGRPVAAVTHEHGLAEDADALEVAGGAVLLALENARLEADLRARMSELRLSRARLVAVADAERRRIERDLHDGAQQQLVALSIKLALSGSRSIVTLRSRSGSRTRDSGSRPRSRTSVSSATASIPRRFASAALSHALPFIAERLPLPITVHVDGLQRVAPEIETAIYSCCLEALQNVAKHTTAETPVDVRLTVHDGELRFNVVDQGPAFDPRSVRHGDGITGMRDRLGAIGGEIEIASTPGHGATITGHVPLGGRAAHPLLLDAPARRPAGGPCRRVGAVATPCALGGRAPLTVPLARFFSAAIPDVFASAPAPAQTRGCLGVRRDHYCFQNASKDGAGNRSKRSRGRNCRR